MNNYFVVTIRFATTQKQWTDETPRLGETPQVCVKYYKDGCSILDLDLSFLEFFSGFFKYSEDC